MPTISQLADALEKLTAIADEAEHAWKKAQRAADVGPLEKRRAAGEMAASTLRSLTAARAAEMTAKLQLADGYMNARMAARVVAKSRMV